MKDVEEGRAGGQPEVFAQYVVATHHQEHRDRGAQGKEAARLEVQPTNTRQFMEWPPMQEGPTKNLFVQCHLLAIREPTSAYIELRLQITGTSVLRTKHGNQFKE